MTGNEPPRDDFAARLDRARAERAGKAGGSSAPSKGAGLQNGLGSGLKVGIDLVAAVIVGGFLGWVVDRWTGAPPWGILGGFLLGIAAGMLSVLRAFNRLGPAGAGSERGGDEQSK